jgi:RND family efflux transporter MFP subunit
MFTRTQGLIAALLFLLAAGGGWFAFVSPEESPSQNAPAADTTADSSGQEGQDAPAKTGEAAQDEEGTIRISPATLQNIGVRTAEVTVEPLRRTIRATGQFEMDERGMRTVSLKAGGWVETLHADYEGAIVKKGEPLLELYSPELVSTQEEYLLALRNARRLENSAEAERLVEATRRRLDHWDLTEAQIERLEETGEPMRTVTFHAPSSGEVMHKNVEEGQHVEPGRDLMDIASVSTVWLIAEVNEQDLPWIEVGMPAKVQLVSDPGQTREARVDHIYHMMETETRTARVRITLPGGHRTLRKPGAYATVYLEAQPAAPAPVVPAEAVVSNGEQDVVLQALGDGRFRPRLVKTGLTAEGRVQIRSGLSGGERIVTSAQFLIDSEARLQGALSSMMNE